MKKRKILSLLLSLCLLIGLLPTAALAADQTNDGAGIRIVQGDAYDSSTGIFSIKVQAKVPTGAGIKSLGVVLTYDNTKLTLVNRNNKKDLAGTEGTKQSPKAAVINVLLKSEDEYGSETSYSISDGELFRSGSRCGLYTFLYTTDTPQSVQTSGSWFDCYEVLFRVAEKPDDPANILNSDSLRIADSSKDDAVIKGVFPANNIYSIYLTDNSDPAKLYVLNKMSKCPDTEVTGEKSLMTAPDTGTATYPGSTNSPSATTYTVSFDANGGTGTMADVTGISGSYTLPANGFTAPAGQQFKGWATSASGTVITGTSITVSTDTKLYAIWEPIPVTEYTITFDGNGGTPSDLNMMTVGKKLSSLPTATRSGRYSFDGWYTAASGGTQITTAYVFSANTTVHAHWTYTGGGGGGGSYTPSYTISVDKTENGTITVSPKSASKGDTVTITVKPDKGYELEMLKVLDKDGDALKLTEKNGKYTFKMPGGKVTVKGSFAAEAPEQIFFDVPVNAYYYDAVKWAADKGITGGVGNGLFAPNQPCTRAQIVTFLWRAAGSPAPKNMSSFTDVPADAFYAKAVAWAVENGITGGTGDGKFSPDATCTRAQSVTFLYRAAGSPKVSSSAEFGDVATNAYYADAVAWAAKNGITGGIGGGLFGSDNDCTRGQIVTFLYRAYNK